MGDNRTASTKRATQAQRRSPSCARPSSPHRYHLRTAKRPTVGDAATGDGLWSGFPATPGSGVTCWRRLRDWQEAGVWRSLHRALLDRLGEADKIDWSRVSLDSDTVRAKGVKRGTHKPKLLGATPQIRANRARSAMLWSKPKEYPF